MLAHIMEEFSLPTDVYRVNSLIGLAKLCIYFLQKGKYQEYLIHKILSVCSQLLSIDVNLMLQLLEKLIRSCSCKEHHTVILCLAFIGRNSSLALEIIEFVLKNRKSNEMEGVSLCNFMCFSKLMNEKLTIFDKLFNSIKPFNKDMTQVLFSSLCNAIVENFPIVQYAGLTIVEEVITSFPSLKKSEIALALNKANSLQTSRDNINELSFPLGLYIDQIIGKIGAVFEIEEFYESEQSNDLFSVIKDSENLYSSSERLYLAKKMIKNNKNAEENEALEILSEIFIENTKDIGEVCYQDMKSLRE